MVKQPTNESNEFQIHSEDFPALPGSQNVMEDQMDVNHSLNNHLDNKSYGGRDGIITLEEKNSSGYKSKLEVDLEIDFDDQLDSEGENNDPEEDLKDNTEDEGLLSSYSRWDVYDHQDDENPFIDEDQVDSPEMMYDEDEEGTSVTQMEMDFFDYIEGLEEYITDDDEDTSIISEGLRDEAVFQNYFVQTTLPSASAVSTECDGDVRVSKRKKKSKKKKTPQFEIMTMGKMGKGKLMSRWQKNCCIRGRRVGNSRRTFLSNNLFRECKERTRKVRSRMSRSCKWIFWSCCEAKALRRFYFFAKTRKDDWCS